MPKKNLGDKAEDWLKEDVMRGRRRGKEALDEAYKQIRRML